MKRFLKYSNMREQHLHEGLILKYALKPRKTVRKRNRALSDKRIIVNGAEITQNES